MESAQQAATEYRGELRIANVGLMCSSLLAPLICAFRERFPKIEVPILQETDFKWAEAVQQRAEVGVGYVSPGTASLPAGALKSWVIATAPIGVAVAATVEQSRQGAAQLQDFADQPFLVLDPKYAPGYLEWTRSIFLQTGFEPVKTILVDSGGALFPLISAHVGVGLLSSLHFGGQPGGVCFRKLTDPVGQFPLSLVWDTQRSSPLVNDFLGVVREALPKPIGALRLNNHRRSVPAAINGI